MRALPAKASVIWSASRREWPGLLQMGKLILASVIIATVAVPALAARDPSAHRGMKRTLLFVFLFNALYVALLTLVYVNRYVPAGIRR
jgi:hypothetical protein